MSEERRPEPTDEELVTRVQQGDAEAFAEIYARHERRLARFLRMTGIPTSEVEDLLGDTFCRALDKIDQFEVQRGKRYLSYLYSIARNLAADRIRYRLRVTSLEEMEDDWEPSDGRGEDAIVNEIYRLEQARLIRAAMDRLGPSDREILVLAYDRELTSREIMEVSGKPSISAVTTHVYKAMKKLRELVAEMSVGMRVREGGRDQ